MHRCVGDINALRAADSVQIVFSWTLVPRGSKYRNLTVWLWTWFSVVNPKTFLFIQVQ